MNLHASAWQYPLHYHALVLSAGTDPGLPSGHTLHRVTVLRPAALMQRPGCEPESLVATQRRPVAKKKKECCAASASVGACRLCVCGCMLVIPPLHSTGYVFGDCGSAPLCPIMTNPEVLLLDQFAQIHCNVADWKSGVLDDPSPEAQALRSAVQAHTKTWGQLANDQRRSLLQSLPMRTLLVSRFVLVASIPEIFATVGVSPESERPAPATSAITGLHFFFSSVSLKLTLHPQLHLDTENQNLE